MNAYIIQNENALFYECNFSCDNAIFLKINDDKAYFITDSRYTFEAKECAKSVLVIDGGRNLLQKTAELIKTNNVRSVIFDPSEWSVEKIEMLKNFLSINLTQSLNFSHAKRQIKLKDEIQLIKQASKEGKKAFDRFCEFIKECGIGLSEKELHFNAEYLFKDKGRLDISFSPIVAINENASKPHALPSDKILKNGDLLLVDGGVKYNRYCSDRTRTVEVRENFNFSKNQIFTDKEKQRAYDTVLLAQETAIKMIKPGIKAGDIDKTARDIIKKAGYEIFFIHSTGHGVGLDIHEFPLILNNSETIIEENMVFTIEPGIYIPNKFGIRIEDMVVVTKNGADVI